MTALYDAALAPVQLNVAQFSLLRHLEHLEPVSISELAQASGHDRSTLARTLQPLERAGLIRMRRGTDDQRTRLPQLTTAGRAAIARALPRWTAAQRRAEAALDGDRDRLFALLGRLDDIRL